MLSAVLSCQKVELPVADASGGGSATDESPSAWSMPEDTGEGTEQSPYTVADILRLSPSLDGGQVWVLGYVVGYVNRSVSNAVLGADEAVQSNILIAARPEEQDPDACLPVELNTDKLHRALSLLYNPDSLGRCLVVHASVELYFRVTGLRGVKDYHWCGGGEAFIPAEGQAPEVPGDGDESQPSPDDDKEGGDDNEGGGDDGDSAQDSGLHIDHEHEAVREGE